MELNIFDVIKGVVNTPKSVELRKKLGKITFRVNHLANKNMICEAVEKIWNVKVRDVRVINLPGKNITSMRKQYHKPGIKKAIITLKQGYKIDLPDQFETIGLSETSASGAKE